MTRLEALRVDAGLSPAELGKMASVSGQTIGRIESGYGAFPRTLRALADALNAALERDDIRASDLRRSALDQREAIA